MDQKNFEFKSSMPLADNALALAQSRCPSSIKEENAHMKYLQTYLGFVQELYIQKVTGSPPNSLLGFKNSLESIYTTHFIAVATDLGADLTEKRTADGVRRAIDSRLNEDTGLCNTLIADFDISRLSLKKSEAFQPGPRKTGLDSPH